MIDIKISSFSPISLFVPVDRAYNRLTASPAEG